MLAHNFKNIFNVLHDFLSNTKKKYWLSFIREKNEEFEEKKNSVHIILKLDAFLLKSNISWVLWKWQRIICSWQVCIYLTIVSKCKALMITTITKQQHQFHRSGDLYTLNYVYLKWSTLKTLHHSYSYKSTANIYCVIKGIVKVWKHWFVGLQFRQIHNLSSELILWLMKNFDICNFLK